MKQTEVKIFITIFFKISINNNIKHYSRISSLGAVFAERYNRTIRDLLKELVFEKGDSNCVDLLPIITKKYNNRVHTSTKLAPKQASLKKNEVYVYKILLDSRKKVKSKFQVTDLVRTADLKRKVSKGDTSNWS